MIVDNIEFPDPGPNRGKGFWLRAEVLLASHRKLADDHSLADRKRFEAEFGVTPNANRTRAFEALTGAKPEKRFRFLLLGDTGEGDTSQYALRPFLVTLKPDFVLINGDIAYPAGRDTDYKEGFFQPNAGLNLPFWAVPGNHEYYSPHGGREFFETFCSKTDHQSLWKTHALKYVPQPGSFWELTDPDGVFPFSVIGLDTGKKGNLDGDTAQLAWLEKRLMLAQAEGRMVLALFHIPALSAGKAASEGTGVRLTKLHALLAKYDCVGAVVCGHVHNYQRYDPRVFRQFLDAYSPGTAPEHRSLPHYFICGSGGAGIEAPPGNPTHYTFQVADIFPSIREWKDHVEHLDRQAAPPEQRSLVDRISDAYNSVSDALTADEEEVTNAVLRAMDANDGLRYDEDLPNLFSFLCVDVSPTRMVISPVLIKSLREVAYAHLPAGRQVDIFDETHYPKTTTMGQKQALWDRIDDQRPAGTYTIAG